MLGLGTAGEPGMGDGLASGGGLEDSTGEAGGVAVEAGWPVLQAESTISPDRARMAAAWRGRARVEAFGMAGRTRGPAWRFPWGA